MTTTGPVAATDAAQWRRRRRDAALLRRGGTKFFDITEDSAGIRADNICRVAPAVRSPTAEEAAGRAVR
jgi:hypothetical protein